MTDVDELNGPTVKGGCSGEVWIPNPLTGKPSGWSCLQCHHDVCKRHVNNGDVEMSKVMRFITHDMTLEELVFYTIEKSKDLGNYEILNSSSKVFEMCKDDIDFLKEILRKKFAET